MKQRFLAASFAIALFASHPLAAVAADDSDKPVVDSRLDGFGPKSIVLDGGSTALMYLLIIVLAGLCLGVLFKDAKRTHLD